MEIVYSEEGNMSIGYGALTPLLVEAIKGLKAEKDSEIQNLQLENQALKDALCEIKPELELCK